MHVRGLGWSWSNAASPKEPADENTRRETPKPSETLLSVSPLSPNKRRQVVVCIDRLSLASVSPFSRVCRDDMRAASPASRTQTSYIHAYPARAANCQPVCLLHMYPQPNATSDLLGDLHTHTLPLSAASALALQPRYLSCRRHHSSKY